MSGRLIAVSSCQLCGSDQASTLFTDPPYEVHRCTQCSFVYVSPRYCDETIHQVYDADYWNSGSPKTKGYANYASEEPLYLKTFRRRRTFVENQCPSPARILDVGCAAGYFLRVMRDAGHTVFGVELSAPIAQKAIEHLGAERGFIGQLEQAPAEPFAPGSFDLVTMWDVIEHVPDPHAMLQLCKRMLKPGGRILLETQNVDSRFAALLGRRWHHFKHEEHIYHFHPRTIRDLLHSGGLEVEHLTTAYGGKYVSLGFIAERAGRLNRGLSLLLKPLTLARKANLYVNLRDEMLVVARPTQDSTANGSAEAQREVAPHASTGKPAE